MTDSPPTEPATTLQPVDIHDVLSNERRQLTLQILSENGDDISARELSERIAERETGEQPPPRNIRQSAYVSLQQTHLPKLDKLGIVDYDMTAKRVSLAERADEVIDFMNSEASRPRDEILVASALTGLFLLIVSRFSGPGLLATGADILVALLLLLIGGIATYRLGW